MRIEHRLRKNTGTMPQYILNHVYNYRKIDGLSAHKGNGVQQYPTNKIIHGNPYTLQSLQSVIL